MRTRLVTISIAFSALAACNLYFGDSQHDTTPPQDPDAGFFTPDGNGGCCPPDAGSGSGSGCHTPDAGWVYPDAGSGWGWPDAGGWPPDDGGVPDDAGSGSGSGSGYPDAGGGWNPDGGCC
ncbi:MAG TPA: hypothetical protein VL463_03235 [Kofleriaceae bacterium]|nr:hypothetical protein [Kofleriaceae bacterium]